MRSSARFALFLLLCGVMTLSLAARPSSRPPTRPNVKVDDPAIKCTPTPAPGTPGSPGGAPLGPIHNAADWTYRATYKKSAKLFAIGCYDKDGYLIASIEVSNLDAASAPGRPPKGARQYLKIGNTRMSNGTFTIKGPPPRPGARYRFATTNIDPKTRNWDISGDVELQVLP